MTSTRRDFLNVAGRSLVSLGWTVPAFLGRTALAAPDAKRPGANHSTPDSALVCPGWPDWKAFLPSTRSRPRDSSAPKPLDGAGPGESDVMAQQSVGKWSKTQGKTTTQRVYQCSNPAAHPETPRR